MTSKNKPCTTHELTWLIWFCYFALVPKPLQYTIQKREKMSWRTDRDTSTDKLGSLNNVGRR